jgi:UDP-N-acetylmuramate dehydrogenase
VTKPVPAAPPVLLADYTTLGLGGPAGDFVSAATERELVGAVRAADASGTPVLLIGGGSNLVISDAGFPGTVIHVNTRGLRSVQAGDGVHAGDGAVDVTVAAGEDWDGVVAATVADGLAGLEPLSGIPGRAGATPIQNVGAYGREVADVITEVRVYDRQENRIRVVPNEWCSFSYRSSLFKSGRPESLVPGSAADPQTPGPHAAGQPRYVVIDATFRLARQALSAPVRYAELAAELGIAMGEQAGVGEVRAAVVKIRARKGMVINPGDPDTRSAGSFFTNPVITAAELGRVEAAAAAAGAGQVPRYPAGDGLVKVPAAWLIEHAGFAKGYGAPAAARVSSKHTLALVNTGSATTADLLALAREIIAGVRAAYGVTLTPEPILVGLSL